MNIVWTETITYETNLRGFDLVKIEHILRHSPEPYLDVATMNRTRMVCFEKDDVLHLSISGEPEAGSIETSPNITAGLNQEGELIGIEILNASALVRDFILHPVQGNLLKLAEEQPA